MKNSPVISYSGKYVTDSREELLEKIQKQMSQKRFTHVLGVEEAALDLAQKYNGSLEKASIAALTHDYAKEREAKEFEQVIREEQFDLDLLDYGND